MATISNAAIKKAILAVEAERQKHPAPPRPDRAELAALKKNRLASSSMLSACLTKAGLDLKRFAALQEEHGAALDRIVARQKADALALAAQHKGTLQSSIVAQSTALRDLTARPEFFPFPSFNLAAPFGIWTSPLFPLGDSAIVPFASWVKFRLATDARQGTQKIGFYFYWENPIVDDYAVIDAATYVSATGHLRAHAPWSFAANGCRVLAELRFGAWQGGLDGMNSTPYDVAPLGGIAAYSWLGFGPHVEAAAVSAGASLSKTVIPVPPNQGIVFEVSMVLDYENDTGNIEADFESGDFMLACPVVVIFLRNSPRSAVA
jgi:hypothetical protein